MPRSQIQKQAKSVPSKEFSFDHAMEAAENMLHLAEVLAPMQREEERRQRKFQEFPKGFHLEGEGYTCFICHNSCSKEDTWYDQYGIKCMGCQGAVDRGEIPPTAADRDTWYSAYDFESDFNVNRHALKRWVKAGVLKEHIVKPEHRQDVHLFFIEENKDVLPPKELVKSQTVSEWRDGKEWFHSEPWYLFVNPHEHLKGYKIMDYLQMVDGKLEPKDL